MNNSVIMDHLYLELGILSDKINQIKDIINDHRDVCVKSDDEEDVVKVVKKPRKPKVEKSEVVKKPRKPRVKKTPE